MYLYVSLNNEEKIILTYNIYLVYMLKYILNGNKIIFISLL
jgi:hypothetical protein